MQKYVQSFEYIFHARFSSDFVNNWWKKDCMSACCRPIHEFVHMFLHKGTQSLHNTLKHNQFLIHFPKYIVLKPDNQCARFSGRGILALFLKGCAAWGLKPYPYLKIFLKKKKKKNCCFDCFLEICENRDLFLRGFSPKKWLKKKKPSNNNLFCKIGSLFRIFFGQKWGPYVWGFLVKNYEDFLWKTNPYGRHIPVYLNIWVCQLIPSWDKDVH